MKDIEKQSWLPNWCLYVWNHKIAILSFLAFIYLIFYTIYSFNNSVKEYLSDYESLVKYLSQVSILVFTSGIFAASLKYMQLLEIFKSQFNDYIESSRFDEVLKNNLKIITFSDDYLTQQSNLPTLWKKITLCMYKNEFPAIHEKIAKKIKNEFFAKATISYYYKNFDISYEVSNVDGTNLVKTIERASYTIVRPSKDEFDWDFGYKCPINKTLNSEMNISATVLTTGQSLSMDDVDNLSNEKDFIIKLCSKLSGHLEYHIERTITSVQDISEDKVQSFGSDRIIDVLSFNIMSDKNIEVFPHIIGSNKFYQNGVFKAGEQAFINRDVFLPGPKFLLIYSKKEI